VISDASDASASDAIVRFAEEPEDELPEPWLPGRRIVRPGYTLSLSPSPTFSRVSRIRTTRQGLDATIAEARATLRELGYVACAWAVGPSCRPAGLAGLLVERGFVPATGPLFEPRYAVMTLTRPPPEPTPHPGVEARVVRTYEEYVQAFRAGLVASGEREEGIAALIQGAPAGWEHESGVAKMTHIAYADGQVAGLGFASYGPAAVMLAGGAVLPAYRGRGVYRALVASRWLAAIRMEKPALVVHAGAMSRPILERCGFEEVCRVELFADPAL
jgi:GNAT superfamily N-acetyltransferase